MIARAISRYNRLSPKKARLLTRPLQGLTVAEAYAFLRNANKRAARFIYIVLKSAFDNAHKKDPNVKETDLYISKITADSGPMSKRYRAASMGRATMIRKRTSHLTVHLDRRELPKKEIKKKVAARRGPIFRKKTNVDKKRPKQSPEHSEGRPKKPKVTAKRKR